MATVGTAPTPSGTGYWLVASDGGVFAFGDAALLRLHGRPSRSTSRSSAWPPPPTARATGWWPATAASSPSATPASSARRAASRSTSRSSAWPPPPTARATGWSPATAASSPSATPASTARGRPALNQPIVGMAATPDGKGYWLVATDGGIFAFGDAGFYGSRAASPQQADRRHGRHPRRQGLLAGRPPTAASSPSATPRFYGSTGGQPLNKPIVGMAATPDGKGYWLVATDGGVFAFGDAGFFGSAVSGVRAVGDHSVSLQRRARRPRLGSAVRGLFHRIRMRVRIGLRLLARRLLRERKPSRDTRVRMVRHRAHECGAHCVLRWYATSASIQLGLAAALANRVDLAPFPHKIVVLTTGGDHGKTGGGVVLEFADATPLEPTFIFHEMGHEFGLDHSFGENPAPCAGGDRGQARIATCSTS